MAVRIRYTPPRWMAVYGNTMTGGVFGDGRSALVRVRPMDISLPRVVWRL